MLAATGGNTNDKKMAASSIIGALFGIVFVVGGVAFARYKYKGAYGLYAGYGQYALLSSTSQDGNALSDADERSALLGHVGANPTASTPATSTAADFPAGADDFGYTMPLGSSYGSIF